MTAFARTLQASWIMLFIVTFSAKNTPLGRTSPMCSVAPDKFRLMLAASNSGRSKCGARAGGVFCVANGTASDLRNPWTIRPSAGI